MSTETLNLPEIDTEITEPDGKAHYVRIKALMLGGPVVALCGKKYVPTEIAKAGEREICPPCKDLFGFLIAMDGT